MSSFAWTQFLGQVYVGYDPQLCITFPVGSYFADRPVAYLEQLTGAFAIASESASQYTFLLSVFLNATILPELHQGGSINHLFFGSYQICGYFTSILRFFS